MPARDRSLGLAKCNTQENIIDLPPDASSATTDPRLKTFLGEMAHEFQEMRNGKNVQQFRDPETDPGD